MSMPLVFGETKIVWGVQPVRPIVGAPDGKQRIRLRPKSVATLFVKTADGIRQFYLEHDGENWRPGIERGRNFRPNQ